MAVQLNTMEAVDLPYQKLSPAAYIPTRATPRSIGLDLYSPIDVLIPGRDKAVINTQLSFQIPLGYYGRIAPRSGLTLHRSIHIGAGVIDPDYTGPVCVILLNLGTQPQLIETGNRIAQLILERVGYPVLRDITPGSPVERGNQGFGSSGQ